MFIESAVSICIIMFNFGWLVLGCCLIVWLAYEQTLGVCSDPIEADQFNHYYELMEEGYIRSKKIDVEPEEIEELEEFDGFILTGEE